MMEERPKLKSYEVWLKYAKGDLKIAQIEVEGIHAEIRCFHAQQAVEKALKAIIIAHNHEITKTHNIKLIIQLLSSVVEIPSFIEAAEYLTDYASAAKYP